MTSPVNKTSLDGVSDLVSDHTEQAAIELVYIKQGNQIIGDAMTSLTSALNTTQSALNLLTLIQQIHNKVSVASPSAFPFNFQTGQPTSTVYQFIGFDSKTSALNYYNSNAAQRSVVGSKAWILDHVFGAAAVSNNLNTTAYQQIYTVIASAYYSNPINPTTSVDASDLETLLSTKTLLAGQINALSAQTSALAKGNGSLLFALKTVYAELPSTLPGLQQWVLDKYTSPANAASAGVIQNDLTTAITAAQSLNDSQKENVRKFLFIFQEYYQSASAVLSQITQIIEKMAQKISQ